MTKATTAVAMWAIGLLCFACGDDTTSGGGGTGGGGTGGGRPDPVQCGSDTCTGGDICMVTPQEPECENKQNPSDPCPPDKPNDTFCGGAGGECCCGEAPPSLYECDPASACGTQVTCDCLTDVCPPDWMCSTTAEPGQFVCEFLAP